MFLMTVAFVSCVYLSIDTAANSTHLKHVNIQPTPSKPFLPSAVVSALMNTNAMLCTQQLGTRVQF